MTGCSRSPSSKAALAGSLSLIPSSAETSEGHVLDLHDPQSFLAVVAPRVQGVKYKVEHWQNELLITTNRDVNFKLMSVPLHIVLDKQKAADNSQWTSVFAYDPAVQVAS
ncbi:hypothetical protein H257_16971, partial [Aphanomyces astaci]